MQKQKRIVITVDEGFHKAIKTTCSMLGITIQDFALEALTVYYVEKYRKVEPIDISKITKPPTKKS